jgi:hypothetical protein
MNMSNPSTSEWRAAGATSNTAYFEVEPGVLAGVPHQGARDDGRTARENVEFQNAHFRQEGRAGCVVIFFDRLSAQDAEARRVYQSEPDPRFMRATALVGGTLLGRAMGSFFLGISRPRIPVKLFGTLDEALAWARELNRTGSAQGATAGGR